MKSTRANINLHNMDCMPAMAEMEDNQFDLAIVDPPYGIVSQKKRGIGSRIDKTGKMNNWNHKKPDEAYINELFRISRNQIIWGANNFQLPPTEYFVIWYKMQTVDNFATCEYAWTNYKKPAKLFKYSIHQHNKTCRIHPTQKPVPLYKWLLQNYAKEGDKILDTHLGSGSIAIACWDLGYDLEAYEKDKEYYDAACKRFDMHCKQLQLF